MIFIEQVHGAAGSNALGRIEESLGTCGRREELELARRQRAHAAERLASVFTIVSNTDVRMAEAFSAPEIGGDHFARAQRSSRSRIRSRRRVPTCMSAPRSTRCSRAALDRATRSIAPALHRDLDQAGSCDYNYGCAYRTPSAGRAERAAADDPQPTHRVQPAVWRRHR